jgi:hypothetical protein
VLLLVPLELFGPFLGVARGGVGHSKCSDGRLSDLRPRERIGEGPPRNLSAIGVSGQHSGRRKTE